MSHDIRTPLNGIIGLIDINDKHADDRELVDSNRQKERVAAEHLLELINDVLEFNKIGSADVKLAYEPFNTIDLCTDVLTITAARAAESGINFVHEDCSANISYPYVFGSPLHVRQIFINITGNAIKYNRKGGSVSCKTSCELRSDGRVWYTVIIADTGIGMSEEFLKHLYDPFSQERSKLNNTTKGTGLGLPIVKRLVEAMNGTISVKSKPNEGTEFIVELYLPVAEADVSDTLKYRPGSSLNGKKILLAEDNEINTYVAKLILEEAGCTVTTAENGSETVEIFRSSAPSHFDAILMDVRMPVTDGLEATRQIRSLDRPDAAAVPIIAMTADAFADEQKRTLESGMNYHISKPIDPSLLYKVLSEYTDR